MTRAAAGLALALALSGCTDFALLAQLKPRKVVLRVNDSIALADGGTVMVPRPRAGLKPCIAWVDVAITKQWQKVVGSWTADGECTLHDVPPGELMLNRGQDDSVTFIRSEVDDVDIGADYTGRPFTYAEPKTTLTVDLSGTVPLGEFNFLSMYLPEFGTGLLNLSGGGNAQIGVPTGLLGATSFPATFDFEGLPLVKADDSVDVFQGAPLSAGTISYVLAKKATVKLSLVSGQNVRTASVMANLPTRSPGFPVFTFDPKTYGASITADLISPKLVGTAVYQSAVLSTTQDPLAIQATYLFAPGPVTTLSTDADPFPGRAWTRRIELQGVWDSVVTTKNSTTGTEREGAVTLTSIFHGPADDLGWMNAGWLTPVRNIQAVKRDGTMVETGAIGSASPTLVWDPPVAGLPNIYLVAFYEMTVDSADDTKLKFKRQKYLLRTNRAEVHVPPGLLALDTNYVFTVTATNCIASTPARPTRLNFQPICSFSEARSRVMFTPEQ